jgi:glutamate 5-kinase
MDLVDSVARLRKAGRDVLLVSRAGAVSMGMRALGLKERPRSLGLRQACAARRAGAPDARLRRCVRPARGDRRQVLLTEQDLGRPRPGAVACARR